MSNPLQLRFGMSNPRVVIAGGTGQLGSTLTNYLLERGYEVVVLSRSSKSVEGAQVVQWDGKAVGDWSGALDGAYAVINLSGYPVVYKWTKENKTKMWDSRVDSSKAIAEAIEGIAHPPQVWINASAVGYYGDTGDREVCEATKPGEGFMSELAQAWEIAVFSAKTPNTRKVCLRIGVVMGESVRFLSLLKKSVQMFLGAAFGSGKQYISWIHEEDVLRLFEWAMNEPVKGAINACAPNPVTNADLMAKLRTLYCRPALPNVPAPVLRVVASVLGTEPALVLQGQRALPEIALAHGFRFKYGQIDEALEDLIDTRPAAWRTA